MAVDLRHGGNREALAEQLGCRPDQLLDASASLAPWTPRLRRPSRQSVRDYPDRRQQRLRQAIAEFHGLKPHQVLPGNGAAELFTWAARDAARAGLNVLPAPGFADYSRALSTWQATTRHEPLPLRWASGFPQTFPDPGCGDVLWVCNPHNPTGQLWSRTSLESLLDRFALVICDEAFLPLVPQGEQHSLISLVTDHPNLVVIRSLTKLFGIAGLRLGYAIAAPDRLQQWQAWRDPWPVNGFAEHVAVQLIGNSGRYGRWSQRVQRWTRQEGHWMQQQLANCPGVEPLPSAANFLLIRSERSLLPVKETLEQRHRILLRDCRSFHGLDQRWLRISLMQRRDNRRILAALRQTLKA